MTTEQKKIALISKIANLEDEQLLEAVGLLLEESLPKAPREPGWGKGIFTYVSDDFDNFIPPGFDEDNEIFP
ncbi:hypothetical protein [Telluribacter sp.]|jgi:hypothetical protein|uniref:hypothetical protein n=1 Tax=Telluribacter sp. TaxID=1978767 RepID=UPI002E14F674|nr:hypothetical protein [Telluribacter sp.]